MSKDMKNTIHRYPFPGPLLFWVFNLFAIYMILGGLMSSVYYGITEDLRYLKVYPFFLVFGLFTLFIANVNAEITTDEEGLLIRFCFWKFRVKWNEIVEVKPDFLNNLFKPLSRFLSISTIYVVNTSGLTLFHRFYGLYAFSFSPSFIIASRISGFDELIAGIQNKRLIQRNEI